VASQATLECYHTPEMRRCGWARTELLTRYHDKEWGVAVHDDRRLFEFLILEGAQAGLSWETILKKRENYRAAFAGFDPARVARFTKRRVERLLADSGIVRNRRKVEAAVQNARAFLEIQREFGSFDAYIWRWTGGRPKVNRWRSQGEIPARTPESDLMSRDLSKRGFRFVGPTICYAFMQAVGMVNDHVTGCFRRRQLQRRFEPTLSPSLSSRPRQRPRSKPAGAAGPHLRSRDAS
jgi:DNA-3-methyladenine glycosylase I